MNYISSSLDAESLIWDAPLNLPHKIKIQKHLKFLQENML